jgi:hypothetical protein
MSADGIANLVPVPFFTGAGRKPPMGSLGLQTRSYGVTPKDTFVNIRDTGEFVVNIVRAVRGAGCRLHLVSLLEGRKCPNTHARSRAIRGIPPQYEQTNRGEYHGKV